MRMSVPPFSRSRMLALSAAGFIATRTFGASPGVTMSREAKWIWNADTPASVPAGALISAGKSGSVARSFPRMAVALVKRSPVNCMPSPESPANRTTTRSFSRTAFVVISLLGKRFSYDCGPSLQRSYCTASPTIDPSMPPVHHTEVSAGPGGMHSCGGQSSRITSPSAGSRRQVRPTRSPSRATEVPTSTVPGHAGTSIGIDPKLSATSIRSSPCSRR